MSNEKDKVKENIEVAEKPAEKANKAVTNDVEAFIARKLKALNNMPDSHLKDYLASRILNNRKG